MFRVPLADPLTSTLPEPRPLVGEAPQRVPNDQRLALLGSRLLGVSTMSREAMRASFQFGDRTDRLSDA